MSLSITQRGGDGLPTDNDPENGVSWGSFIVLDVETY